jgi:hypothetical protein
MTAAKTGDFVHFRPRGRHQRSGTRFFSLREERGLIMCITDVIQF